MYRRLLFLCFILMVGCARPNNSISNVGPKGDARLLWQNHAGSIKGNYVVQDLPDVSTLTTIPLLSNTSAYSAPVIFKDENGVQTVLVLTYDSASKLELIKYTMNGDSLVQDEEFSISSSELLSHQSLAKHHQIALIEEDGDIFVYVTHSKGISKFNVNDPSKAIAQYNSKFAAFRILVDKNVVYAQSENELIKLDASLAVIKTIGESFGIPNSRPLPLVISGNKLYVPFDNQIGSVVIDTFDSMSLHAFDSPDGSTIGTIAAAGNDGAIYSVIKTESWAKRKYVHDGTKALQPYSKDLEIFGNYAFMFADYKFSTTTFHSLGDANSLVTKINEFFSDCYLENEQSIGDSDYTGLVVFDDALMIPGANTTLFSKQNNQDCPKNPSYVRLGQSKVVSPFGSASALTTDFGNIEGQYIVRASSTEAKYAGVYFNHLKYPDNVDDGTGYHDIQWNYLPRFIVSDGEQSVSVVNISQQLHDLPTNSTPINMDLNNYDAFVRWLFIVDNKDLSWDDYFNDASGDADINILKAYNTQILNSNGGSLSLGNPSEEVLAVAVGDKAMVMLSRDSVSKQFHVYLVK